MKYRLLFSILAIGLAVGLADCADKEVEKLLTHLVVPYETVSVEGCASVNMGWFGSSMAYNAADSSFYLLTDRGPNVAGTTAESLIFPLPDYTPLLGQFRQQGDSLVLVRKIALRQADGTPFTGLPPVIGGGSTGEIPYDLHGNLISNTSRGLDPEGLAVAPDGTFWVSDEYGPSVLHFDREGILIKELVPGAGLPDHYALRRPNRGMEGLTISADGAKLYGIMQSPLYYPDTTTKDSSVNSRMIEIDLHDGSLRESLYRLDEPKNVVSEICFVGDSTLLVLERDGEFPRGGKGFKKVFKIEITPSAEISTTAIEPFSLSELNDKGISPVEKTLFIDILQEIPGYRHDKPEGIAILGDSVLCVVNDDDFGIAPQIPGSYGPKIDPDGQQDASTLYFIRLRR
jgi:hypothetical protein